MSKDSARTWLHLHSSRHADVFEDFANAGNFLLHTADKIFVAPEHLPKNLEEDEDVTPDHHAAFGIQAATNKPQGPSWRDLNMEGLMVNDHRSGSGGGTLSSAAVASTPAARLVR